MVHYEMTWLSVPTLSKPDIRMSVFTKDDQNTVEVRFLGNNVYLSSNYFSLNKFLFSESTLKRDLRQSAIFRPKF